MILYWYCLFDQILTFVVFVFCYQQGTVIQSFIPPNKIETYLPHMFAGSVYWLNNFYGSKSKSVYRVAEPDVTIAFTWNSVLSVLENCPVPFPEDRFRFYDYEEFEAVCDLRGDLYGKLLTELAGLLLDWFGIRGPLAV